MPAKDKLPKVPEGDQLAIAQLVNFITKLALEQPGLQCGNTTVEEAIEALAHLIGSSYEELVEVGKRT